MKKFAKILSVVLCLAMVVSFAAMAFADESKKQITTLEELTTGKYLLVCSNGASLGVIDGTWVTNAESAWTLTVVDGGVTMQDAKGAYLAPKGGNSNGLKTEAEAYAWNVVCTDGMFSFCGTGEDTVTLAFNSGESYLKFRGYKNATVSGEKAADYPSTFALYQVSDDFEGEVPETTAPVAPETTAPATAVEQLQFVSAPVDGTAYKLGMSQLEINKNLYLTGEMDGYYYGTTEDANAAVDIFVENVEGGFKMYFMKDGAKQYLAIVINGTYTNVVFNETGSVFAFNAECKTLQTDVEGTLFYLGTYNSGRKYDTITASKASYINAENTCVTQFPAGLVAVEKQEEPTPSEPVVPETTAPVAPETTAPVAPETTAPVAPETSAAPVETTEAPVATTAPAGSDDNVDETGDSSVIVLAVCMMMATAAVVVLVQKKRAF